jgi:G:T-mismatch repair DNA endonuclease (very short patch repair protein)
MGFKNSQFLKNVKRKRKRKEKTKKREATVGWPKIPAWGCAVGQVPHWLVYITSEIAP